MKKLLVLLAFIPFGLWAQQETPSIVLSMSADTAVMPDIFHLSIKIIDNKGIGKQGIEEAEKKVLLPTLLREGIDIEKHLAISDIQSYYHRNKEMMSKHYKLTLYDTAQVTKVIQQLNNEDIIVSLEKTEVSNEKEIMQLLRVRNMKEALAEAELTLSALNYKVGNLLKVTPLRIENIYSRQLTVQYKPPVFSDSYESNFNNYEKIIFKDEIAVIFAIVK